MKKEDKIKKWDSLSSIKKMSLGGLYITHESNLKVWDKLFKDLSALKKKRVLQSIETICIKL
jgi:hypothetical protein